MSDMSNLYRAYSAVHNEEVKQELTENRDLISEMNMTQMLESDLVEVCEEIVEGLFEYGLDLDESCDVVVSVLEESVGGERNGLRDGKITQIAEAFETVFGTVTDKAERNCEKEFLLYRKNKPLTEKWNNKVSHETGNKRLHESLIASDRHQIKFGLIEMISDIIEASDIQYPTGEKKKFTKDKTDPKVAAGRKAAKEMGLKHNEETEVSTLRQGWGDAYSAIYEKKLDPVGQEDGDIDNDGDEDSSDKYLAKRRKAISKAMKKEGYMPMNKAKVDSQKKKAYDKDMMAQSRGDTKEADKQFKRRMAMDSQTKMKKEEVSFSEAELARIEEIVNSWED